jgi:hypothetical protein
MGVATRKWIASIYFNILARNFDLGVHKKTISRWWRVSAIFCFNQDQFVR